MTVHSAEIIRFPDRMPYADVYAQQIKRRKAIEAGAAGNALFLVEHLPVVTLGRNSKPTSMLFSREYLAQRNIEVSEIDRGGDATYHGPGQVVAYPILNLNEWTPSIKWYLRTLEQVIIRTLTHYGLEGERLEGYTGVWVGGAKVAAIGVGLHNWVTFHGIALNVDPDMEHFGFIIPCGIADKPITTLRALLGTPPPLPEVFDTFLACFREVFEVDPR